MLAQHAAFAATLVAASLLAALLEIQIEGPDGWAASLPTWEARPRWLRWLLGTRSITGYHLYIHLLVLVLVHLPFGLGLLPFSLHAEARILAFLVLFWVLEDFLWFVVNPAWGLERFRRTEIPWHAGAWWAFMPRDYWVFIPVGVGLYVLSL